MNTLSRVFTFLIGTCFLLHSYSVKSEVKPATLFADNMVLQQQQKALQIWGTASPNKQVKILTSWNNRSYSTPSTSNGQWRTTIETPPAGGPYSITFDDGTKTTLSNILIGEVWICAGQSNMEMPMKGFKNQPLEEGTNMDIMLSANPNIRIFNVAHDTTLTLKTDVKGEWQTAVPASIRDFSAAAYYFGRMVQGVLDIPVGIVTVDWGGSAIESWMSKEMLADFKDVKIPTAIKTGEAPQRTSTIIYNGMLHPMIGLNARGMIWYQGESNIDNPTQYKALFEKFVTSIRELWNIGEFPFYYTQIAPYYHYKVNSALLREAQMEAESQIPNVGMIVTMDAGCKQCIHPMKKKVIGERLALQALVRTYGIEGTAAQSPVYKEMTIKKDTVVLKFDKAPMGLTSYYKPIQLFKVAGENRKFHPAKAWIKFDKIYLLSEQVKNPVATRYAFENYVEGELFSVEGLPVSSFRTDKWMDVQ